VKIDYRPIKSLHDKSYVMAKCEKKHAQCYLDGRDGNGGASLGDIVITAEIPAEDKKRNFFKKRLPFELLMAKNRATASEQAKACWWAGHKGEEVKEQASDVKAPVSGSQRPPSLE